MPTIWPGESVRLFSGVVPVAVGVFHKIAVREAMVPHVDTTTLTVTQWSARKYYEVCVGKDVYDLLENPSSAAASVS